MKTVRLLPASLTARFIALMVAVTMLGITLVAAFSLYEHAVDARKDAQRIAIDRALTVLDAMETSATTESLSRFILSTAAQPAIRAIALVNAEGKVVLASRREWQGRHGDTLPASVMSQWLDRPAGDQAEAHWDERHVQAVVIAPIEPINPAAETVRGLRHGRLILALDARPHLAGARAEAWFDALWAGGILLLVMAFLAWILHQRVGRPLQILHHKATHPDAPAPDRDRVMKSAAEELRTLGTAIRDLADTRLALDREKQRLSDIADTIPGAVYEYRHHDGRDDEFTFVSAGVRSLLGLGAQEGPTHSNEEMTALFWSRLHPEDRQILEQATAAANRPGVREWEAEFRIQTDTGTRWLWGHAVPVNDPLEGQLFRGVLLDITERKDLEASLKQAATHDPLTGALNRAGVDPQLETALAGAQRQNQPLAVAMLDIDHFKRVNDAHGHAMGDRVLKQFVDIIQDRLRKSDSLARWGGEEFLVLLPHTDRDGARQLAESIRREVASQAFPHHDPLTVSIGVATARADDSVVDLIRRADDRLYEAKALGRNRVIDGLCRDGDIA